MLIFSSSVPKFARARVYWMPALANMPGLPKRPTGSLIFVLRRFFSTTRVTLLATQMVRNSSTNTFGDDIDVPRSNDMLVQSMTMLEIVRFAELGQQPHHDSAT